MRLVQTPARIVSNGLLQKASRLLHPSVVLPALFPLLGLIMFAGARTPASPRRPLPPKAAAVPAAPAPVVAQKPSEEPPSPLFAAPFYLRQTPGMMNVLFVMTRPDWAALPSRHVQRERLERVEATYPLSSSLLRVGLMRFEKATTLIVRAEPGGRLLGPDGIEKTASGPWTLTATKDGAQARDAKGKSLGTASAGTFWRVQAADEETQTGIGEATEKLRRYRGSLEISAAAGRLRVVNEVPLEQYLRGVLSCEMGAAPLEALKAQAVAARTYALYSLGHFASEGYDLRDTPQSQVYNGVEAETPTGDRAVSETVNLILTRGGQPVPALYCADCGGVTTPGKTTDEFPASVSDEEAHKLLDSVRPGLWTVSLPPEKITALLDKHPQLHGLGTLDAIEILDTDVSKRVQRLRLTWKPAGKPASSLTVPTLDDFKASSSSDPPDQTTGPPSPAAPVPEAEKGNSPKTVREINANTLRSLLGLNSLRSTLFTVKRIPGGDFCIEGRGWGHGRGLCQVGAIAWAQPPFSKNYKAILSHYYAGATLTRIVYQDEGENAAPAPAVPPKGEAHGR